MDTADKNDGNKIKINSLKLDRVRRDKGHVEADMRQMYKEKVKMEQDLWSKRSNNCIDWSV